METTLDRFEQVSSLTREGTVLVFKGEAQGNLEAAIRLDREARGEAVRALMSRL
jgi:hypothetical protein